MARLAFRPLTNAERQAAFRSRVKRRRELENPDAIRRCEFSVYDLDLIASMLKSRIAITAGAEAKAEYLSLLARVEAQAK